MDQSATVDAIERFSLKLFVTDGRDVNPNDIITIFHRWIRERAVPGLLIDVADYGHLPEGPNVLLVAHEANYAFDCAGRPGLAYATKRSSPGALADRVAGAARILIAAARRLQDETAADDGGPMPFRTDRIEFVVNDRLHAPKTADVERALQAVIEQAARQVFRDARVESSPLADPGRTGVTVRIPDAPPIETLT